MSDSQAAAAPTTAEGVPPFANTVDVVLAAAGSDAGSGLSATEAAARLASHGPNAITAEKPPSAVAIAAGLLRDPMNLMLVAVVVVSLLIGEVSTGVLVALLVVLNIGLGTRQELTARASVDALSKMQVPQARVVRDGAVALVPATEVVPGRHRAARGRRHRARPTGASCARRPSRRRRPPSPARAHRSPRMPGCWPPPTSALGDRTNMLFQNTSVTRGTATVVVTATGMETQMGQIATMLTSVTRTRSPLQRELDTLTKVLGIIAWGAVAVIVVAGLVRGTPADQLLLLGTAMAISAIPTGMPAFVSGLLSMGSTQLADAKAVVKNLTDVETLGATSAINTDKTGTLTLNQMMVSTLYASGSWFTVEGEGYRMTGAHPVGRRHAGARTSPGSALGPGARQRRGRRGRRLGDRRPHRGRAGGAGREARRRRRRDPARLPAARRGAVRLRVQVHGDLPPRSPLDGVEHVIELVKGAPDVVIARCSQAGGPLSGSQVPMAQARAGIEAANVRMGEKGLRVLAFAARLVDPGRARRR